MLDRATGLVDGCCSEPQPGLCQRDREENSTHLLDARHDVLCLIWLICLLPPVVPLLCSHACCRPLAEGLFPRTRPGWEQHVYSTQRECERPGIPCCNVRAGESLIRHPAIDRPDSRTCPHRSVWSHVRTSLCDVAASDQHVCHYCGHQWQLHEAGPHCDVANIC